MDDKKMVGGAVVSVLEKSDRVVSVGGEGASSYGGIDALREVLNKARKEGWKVAQAEVEKRRPKHPLDGKLKFGELANMGAAFNDDQYLEELFVAAALLYREKKKENHPKAQALYKQATLGDCNEPEPIEPVDKRRWHHWYRLIGLGRREAKIQYLKLLKKLDPRFVTPMLPEASPPAFPKANGSIPICARCNTKRGCEAEILISDNMSLAAELSKLSVLTDKTKLLNTLKSALKARRCQFGMHIRASSHVKHEFASFFNSPGLGGFQAYSEIDAAAGEDAHFKSVADIFKEAIIREHRAYEYLVTQEGEKQDSCTVAARERLASLSTHLRQLYSEFAPSRIPFTLLDTCQRSTHSCVHKRHLEIKCHEHPRHDSELPRPQGRNLNHAYGGIAELSRATRRHDLIQITSHLVKPKREIPIKTLFNGLISSKQSDEIDGLEFGVVKRAQVLGARIASSHAKALESLERDDLRSRREQSNSIRKDLLKSSAKETEHSAMIKAIKTRDFDAMIHPSPEIETAGGLTALGAAIIANDRSIISKLAKKVPDFLDTPSPSRGLSGLALAAKRGNLVILHHLIEIGASPLLKRQHQLFALPAAAAAADAGQLSSLEVLFERAELQYGAGAAKRVVSQFFGANRDTALHYAVRRKNNRIALELLRRGADFTIKNAQNLSPLDLAFQLKQFKLAEVMQCGPESKRGRELNRRSLLASARLENAISNLVNTSMNATQIHDDTMISLVEQGEAPPDLETTDGSTPLIAAARLSGSESILRLIKAGCDVNYTNLNFRTALMAAANALNLDAALTLIQAGADAKLCDLDGRTALVFAREAQVHKTAPRDKFPVVPSLLESLLLDCAKDATTALTKHQARIENLDMHDDQEAAYLQLQKAQIYNFEADDGDQSWKWRLPAVHETAIITRQPVLRASTSLKRRDSVVSSSGSEVLTFDDSEEASDVPTYVRRRSGCLFTASQAENIVVNAARTRLQEIVKEREKTSAYVVALKASYCERFGGRALDKLVHNQNKVPSSPVSVCTLTTESCTVESPPQKEEVIASDPKVKPFDDALTKFLRAESFSEEDDPPELNEESARFMVEAMKQDAAAETDGVWLVETDSVREDFSKSEWENKLIDLKRSLHVDHAKNILPEEARYEFCKYLCSKGRHEQASATLISLRVKQKKDTRLSECARRLALARTDREQAKLEDECHRPHHAIYLQRRALAVYLDIMGPSCDETRQTRQLMDTIHTLAQLYVQVKAPELAARIYRDLARRYAASLEPKRKEFHSKMRDHMIDLLPRVHCAQVDDSEIERLISTTSSPHRAASDGFLQEEEEEEEDSSAKGKERKESPQTTPTLASSSS